MLVTARVVNLWMLAGLLFAVGAYLLLAATLSAGGELWFALPIGALALVAILAALSVAGRGTILVVTALRRRRA